MRDVRGGPLSGLTPIVLQFFFRQRERQWYFFPQCGKMKETGRFPDTGPAGPRPAGNFGGGTL